VLQNAGTTERLARNLREELQNRGESPVRRYGLALAYAKAGQFAKAKVEWAKVQFPAVAQPADANLLALSKELLRLEIAELSKQKAEWEPAFEKLLAAKPKHRVIGLRFAQALVTEGSDPSARRAIDVLRDLSTAYESDPSVYELMARAYELAGQTVRASEAYARAAAYRGALEDSLAQLETLTRRTDLSYYERARVDALIAEILPIVLEIRARENRSGPPRTG
jgi:beta-barrel assembly-enhancing protease